MHETDSIVTMQSMIEMGKIAVYLIGMFIIQRKVFNPLIQGIDSETNRAAIMISFLPREVNLSSLLREHQEKMVIMEEEGMI